MVLIIPSRFFKFYGRLMGLGPAVKAAAFWPFIFVSKEIRPQHKPFILNHERIHLVQQLEKLLVGQWLITCFGYFYYRFVKRLDPMGAYLSAPSEQEAYDNMFNKDYLNRRQRFADLKKYVKHKPATQASIIVNYFKTEGFKNVYEWQDKPGKVYAPHRHQGRVALYILTGSVQFRGVINRVVRVGERFDVPPGVEHSAKVGPRGCRYVVGEEFRGAA